LLPLLACWGTFGDRAWPQARGEDGYVLLQNGNVIRGEVVTLGDLAVIRRDNVERLKLHSSDVAHAAGTIDELYQHRASKRDQYDLQGLLEDARWCFRNGLPAEAERALKSAEELAPGHPVAIRLRRQWQSSLQPTNAEDADRVRVVAFEEPIAKTASEQAESELDQQLQDLSVPDGALAHFSRQVQPLLISRCGNNGCHRSPSERGWVLTHRGNHVRPPGRMTKQNLATTLDWVNRNEPGQSELLRHALLAHGGKKDPPVKQSDDQALPVIRGWLDSIATWAPAAKNSTASDSAAPLTGLVPLPEGSVAVPLGRASAPFAAIVSPPGTDSQTPSVAGGRVRQVGYLEGPGDLEPGWPATTVPVAPIGYGQADNGRVGPGMPKRVARLPTVDNPFDPEIFNRSYRLANSPAPPPPRPRQLPPPTESDGCSPATPAAP
jgi:hypothetical protein